LRELVQLSRTEGESNPGDWSQTLQHIDGLIRREQRPKEIFDPGRRGGGEGLTLGPLEDEQDVEREAIQSEVEANVDHNAEIIPTFTPLSAPSFLKRDLASKVLGQTASRMSNLSASIASGLARVGGILRGHLEQDVSSFKGKDRAAGTWGAVLAVLSLLVIIVGVGALIAINQIKSLKTEIATLERALTVMKQAPKPETVEGKKDDQRDDRGKAGADKGSGTAQSAAFSALNLSPEEIHLIRDYIKSAPLAGPATLPSISVGDSVTTGTIPLPSPLTDKIPKLLGGRFTIRNGAIVILKRDSRQADAVLPPN